MWSCRPGGKKGGKESGPFCFHGPHILKSIGRLTSQNERVRPHDDVARWAYKISEGFGQLVAHKSRPSSMASLGSYVATWHGPGGKLPCGGERITQVKLILQPPSL